MEIIEKYFQNLSQQQLDQFAQLKDLYEFWNNQINVISRKDIHNLYHHHVLHSLAIAKIIQFRPNTMVLDVGTGGGFPGIPLAIFFPEVNFHLIDGTSKKIKVVDAVSEALKLTNVKAQQIRSNDLHKKFDFVVSRAVASFPEFYNSVKHLLQLKDHNSLPNGILYLKGGDLQTELAEFKKHAVVYNLQEFFREDFFETKKLVYYPV